MMIANLIGITLSVASEYHFTGCLMLSVIIMIVIKLSVMVPI